MKSKGKKIGRGAPAGRKKAKKSTTFRIPGADVYVDGKLHTGGRSIFDRSYFQSKK
jgi:hypothetical protein